jgi:hypothetical protein
VRNTRANDHRLPEKLDNGGRFIVELATGWEAPGLHGKH